ncbi:hypothetical protein [Terriglobus sp. TAA 43]|uniref:hypothetical protein n=1 Tax=Terriglobus sp. TAA 43 TaxID=278961 RepID=UPI00064819EB|nr:hypothetical protein [Terriglobus sp. TAA 43]
MSKLRLRIYDGSRQLFAAPAKFLVTITDGNYTQRVRNYYSSNGDRAVDSPDADASAVLVWMRALDELV